MDTSALTNIPPKRLLLIAVGGIGAGLLWRKFSNRGGSSGGSVATDANGVPVDLSKLALAQNNAGNLGASQTEPIPNVNDATRDLGSGFFPIPVTVGITRGADGHDYYVDPNGKILGPVVVGGAVPGMTTGTSSTVGTLGGTPRTFTTTQQYLAAKIEQDNAMKGMSMSERQTYMKEHGYI